MNLFNFLIISITVSFFIIPNLLKYTFNLSLFIDQRINVSCVAKEMDYPKIRNSAFCSQNHFFLNITSNNIGDLTNIPKMSMPFLSYYVNVA